MRKPSPAVEPSEILFDRRGTLKEESFAPNPLLRFLARFFDYSLWLILLSLIPRLSRNGGFIIPLEYLLWIPIEALMLATWGKTVGKYFLKIGLRQGRRTKFSLVTSFRRAIAVWFRGLGMMIPFLNCFCMFLAYQKLKMGKQASWDLEEGTVVFHRPIGRWRIVSASLITLLAFLFYYVKK